MKSIYTKYKILIITILMTGAFLPNAAIAEQGGSLKTEAPELEGEPDCERSPRLNTII